MDETQQRDQLYGGQAEMARTGEYTTLLSGLMPEKRYVMPRPWGRLPIDRGHGPDRRLTSIGALLAHAASPAPGCER